MCIGASGKYNCQNNILSLKQLNYSRQKYLLIKQGKILPVHIDWSNAGLLVAQVDFCKDPPKKRKYPTTVDCTAHPVVPQIPTMW